MVKKYLFVWFFLLSILTVSCDMLDPEEPIPAYIRIDTVLLETGLPGVGVNSHTITDVWVTIEGKQIGVFEIPVTFPVLGSGLKEIVIKAGIKENGISNNRKYYEYYTFYEKNAILIEGEVLTMIPVFSYDENAVLDDWSESFQDPNNKFEISHMSDTGIYSIEDPSNEFNMVGAIYVDSERPQFEALTQYDIDRPDNYKAIYLELDHENNIDFQIGLIVNMPSESSNEWVIGINKKAVRSKIYINLTPYISSHINAQSYRVYIKASKEEGIDTGIVYLDNIKIVRE